MTGARTMVRILSISSEFAQSNHSDMNEPITMKASRASKSISAVTCYGRFYPLIRTLEQTAPDTDSAEIRLSLAYVLIWRCALENIQAIFLNFYYHEAREISFMDF